MMTGSDGMRDAWYAGKDEFWKHYEVMTGKPKPSDNDGVYRWYFSCSC